MYVDHERTEDHTSCCWGVFSAVGWGCGAREVGEVVLTQVSRKSGTSRPRGPFHPRTDSQTQLQDTNVHDDHLRFRMQEKSAAKTFFFKARFARSPTKVMEELEIKLRCPSRGAALAPHLLGAAGAAGSESPWKSFQVLFFSPWAMVTPILLATGRRGQGRRALGARHRDLSAHLQLHLQRMPARCGAVGTICLIFHAHNYLFSQGESR